MNVAELEPLTTVNEAAVFKAGRLAATLERRDGTTRFAYRPDYLQAGGPAVATTLPVVRGDVETSGGAIPPFFAGLLPEGRRLSSLRRAVKTSADDELSLLLAVGSDTIGDVQVLPHGASPSPAPCLVEIGRDLSRVRFSDVLAASGVVDRVGLPGVQDKASARMIAVPVSRAGARFLLKVDPPDFPGVVVNEAFFLRLARASRIPCAEARVVHDAAGTAGLLVKRFDRSPRPDGTTHALVCEDACQVRGLWPADKYRMSCEDLSVALADPCAARAVALRDLFRQLVFAYLTGNGDAHAKNFSILQSEDGEWRVAPAYDLPATVPYGDTTLALPVQGRTAGVSRRHWLAFADDVGLPRRAAERVLDDLGMRLADLGGQLRDGALPFPQRATADWIAELRHRHRLVAAAAS